MGRIARAIREHRARRVVATCGICGEEHLDTKKESLSHWSPAYIEGNIEIRAETHRDETGHDDLDVDIEKEPKPEPIETTITVGEVDAVR